MGLLRIVITLVGILVLAIVGIGAYLWFTDYDAQAKVTATGSDWADVTPALVPTWHYRAQLDSTTASFVCVGYHVDFRVQTHALRVTDSTGRVIYAKDASGHETKDYAGATRCALMGV